MRVEKTSDDTRLVKTVLQIDRRIKHSNINRVEIIAGLTYNIPPLLITVYRVRSNSVHNRMKIQAVIVRNRLHMS